MPPVLQKFQRPITSVTDLYEDRGDPATQKYVRIQREATFSCGLPQIELESKLPKQTAQVDEETPKDCAGLFQKGMSADAHRPRGVFSQTGFWRPDLR